MSLKVDIEDACTLLFDWKAEGRVMPGYVPTYGKPHLALLLGFTEQLREGGDLDYYERFAKIYKASGSRLVEHLLGPHGWTAYQAAVVRMQQREAKIEKAKISKLKRNKKRRLFDELQREENYYAGFQNVSKKG